MTVRTNAYLKYHFYFSCFLLPQQSGPHEKLGTGFTPGTLPDTTRIQTWDLPNDRWQHYHSATGEACPPLILIGLNSLLLNPILLTAMMDGTHFLKHVLGLDWDTCTWCILYVCVCACLGWLEMGLNQGMLGFHTEPSGTPVTRKPIWQRRYFIHSSIFPFFLQLWENFLPRSLAVLIFPFVYLFFFAVFTNF